MADSTLLSILAGTDPQTANILAAAQGLQLQGASLDPNFGHNEGMFGALAKTLAGARGAGMLNSALPQIIAARQAALPELAKVYGSPNPLQTIAQGGLSPNALAMALSGVNPINASEAQLRAAQMAAAQQQMQFLGKAGDAAGRMFGTPGIAALGGAGAANNVPSGGGGGAASAAPRAAPITGGGAGFPQGFTGRYPGQDTQGTEGAAPNPLQSLIANPKAVLSDPNAKAQAAQQYRSMMLRAIQQQQIQRLRQAANQGGAMPSLGSTPPPT